MIRKPYEMVVCQICKENKKLNELLSGELVRKTPREPGGLIKLIGKI